MKSSSEFALGELIVTAVEVECGLGNGVAEFEGGC